MSTNLIGKVLLDQFRVEAFVASGGMAAVYKVWDLKRNVPLAMKILHSDLAEDPAMFRRFKREAQALRKLAHPHIVPFYGLFQAEDFSFLLEAFINGPTLKDILRQTAGQPLPLMDTLSILKALCAALGYAHASGVVHCDVKPGNVMVDQGANIYLADFGIARHADSTSTTTGVAGTPAYMAPEQIRGEPVSAATDIYALAVLLFELLTGQRPFRGEAGGATPNDGGATQAERIRKAQLSQAPPDPRVYNPAVPPALAGAVLRALEKDPARRYGDMMAFFTAVCAAAGIAPERIPDRVPERLRQAAYREPPVVPPPPIPIAPPTSPIFEPTKPPPRKALWGVMGAAALVVAAILFMAFNNGGGPKPGPATQAPGETATLPGAGGSTTEGAPVLTAPPAAPATEEVLAPESGPALTDTPPPQPPAPTEPVQPAPDTRGEWIAYAYDPQQYNRDLFMYSLVSGETRQLTSNRNGNNAPTFAPDGSRIAFAECPGNTCSLRVMDWQTRVVTPVNVAIPDARFPDWCHAPGSPWIAFEGREGSDVRHIWKVNIETGDLEQVTNGNTDISPSWSPDCSEIVFERYDANGISDLYIQDLAAGTERPLVRSADIDEFNVSWSPDGEWIAFGRIGQDTNGDGRLTYTGDQKDLYIIRPDGSDERNLTAGRYSIFGPSWSPDSDQILFGQYYGEGNFELMTYRLSSGEFNPLGLGSGPYYHAQWGP